MPDDQLSNVLQHRFGFSQFRFHQEAIIRSVLAGSDVMAIMPTGGGKSICYQLPALMLDGITIVISPLIALMKDQVDGLKANGIAAAFLNSSQSAREQEQIREQLKKGAIRLLYIAPERLFGGDQGFFSVLKSLPVALFAIDEAHCISQWGHDFRPEYLRLAAFKEHFPQVPVIALTASADKITQQDILEKLRLRSPRVFVSSFNRPNIHYFIQPKKQAMQQIADYLHTHADSSGIIYALSRAGTEDIAHALRSMGFIAAHYHAGLSNEEKNRVQESFKKDDLKIIVATIAFGMGIDKPNVRFVMHYDVPKNMEGYYQETGRAGRDGLKSDAILYYSAGDIMKLQNFISIEGNPEQTAVLSRKLFKMKDFAETQSCRRQFIMDYFGEEFPPICGSCDFCLSHVDQENVTIPAQKFLSAIYRTGERFGSDYIIDFLRGSSNSKIQEHHKSLKTYGIGKDLRKEVWVNIARQLLQQRLADVAEGKYPVLKLNPKSWEILKGEREVTISVRKEKEPVLKALRDEEVEYHQELLQILKHVRRELATQENVPAYIIVGDNTLQEMATYFPVAYEDMRRISGFGDYKISKYGAAFLEEIKDYVQRNKLKPRMHLKISKKEIKPKRLDKQAAGNTQRTTLGLFREGNSISDIANRRGLSATTIESHLAVFVSTGEIEATEIVKKERLDTILEVIRMTGDTRALKPLKDLLDESYTYAEIRIAVAHYNLLAEGSK